MKDMDAAKQILGLRIERDRVAGTLKLIQNSYIEKGAGYVQHDRCKACEDTLGDSL